MEAAASSSSVEQTVDVAQWEENVKSHHMPRADLNKLVMEYLVKEGFKDAVLSFEGESGIDPGVDMKILDEQIKIRAAVESGSIQDAVELVNDVDPEILDTNPKLFFHLQQQQLLEYIRQGDVEKVLDYAQKELSARGEENPEFLEELEQTLALLAFDNTSASPFSELLEHPQRLKVVSELNAAVLASQDQTSESKLGMLMKLVLWAQDQLTKKGLKFPKLANIGSCKLETD
ncbi:glucose-induced degradation protein 8 homolog [Halichondria panicea]|uniref:glucose-induced degradation protein 8 homolog n=1 Tax=Halichondria panicea TaxID=6063 RepID=UPI00312B401B